MNYVLGYGFFHRALAAFLAIRFRLDADKLAALAGPPFRPPRRPRATAAGFLCWTWGSPVASETMDAASWLGSVGLRFLDRLSMTRL